MPALTTIASAPSGRGPRIDLLGAGAVGTVLAAYLQVAGHCQLRLRIRARDQATLASIAQLRIERSGGKAEVRCTTPALGVDSSLDGVDYLLICVKHSQLDTALSALPPIPPTCTLVSTLNGPGALARIQALLPACRVISMTVMYNAQWLAPLQARLSSTPRVLISAQERALRQAFAGSGMQVADSAGLASSWGKLLINLANAIAAITQTTFEELLTQPALRGLYVAVLDEAIAVLRATHTPFKLPMPVPYALYRHLLAGRTPLPWWFARARNGLRGGAFPSMVADLQAGRRTEVRELNGEIVALAASAGLSAPLNQQLVALVTQREQQASPQYLSAQALHDQLLKN